MNTGLIIPVDVKTRFAEGYVKQLTSVQPAKQIQSDSLRRKRANDERRFIAKTLAQRSYNALADCDDWPAAGGYLQ